jgi:hypothetical protein
MSGKSQAAVDTHLLGNAFFLFFYLITPPLFLSGRFGRNGRNLEIGPKNDEKLAKMIENAPKSVNLGRKLNKFFYRFLPFLPI